MWDSAFVLLLLAVCVLGEWQQDELALVKKRMWKSALSTASFTNLNDILSKLQPDGSFSDLKYGQDNSNAFMKHGRRQSALMFHHINSDEDLTQQVISTYKYITYDAPPNIDENWWGHQIGTPMNMWEGVVLASDLLSQELLHAFLNRWWSHTAKGPVWDITEYGRGGDMSGGNLGPRTMLAEVEALLRGAHEPIHTQVRETLYHDLAEMMPFQGNGLRPDGCLHQHNIKGNHETAHGYLDHTLYTIYNGNYGKEMLRYVSDLMSWYTGTRMEFEEETVEALFMAMLECQQWLFRGHTFEPTTCGRHITSGQDITRYATLGGIHYTVEHLRKLGRHQEELAAIKHRYSHVLPEEQYALIGNKHFFSSDLMVQQRREYMASVRVLSNRTARPESWPPHNNGKGYFQADGFMTVLVDGGEYGEFRKEVFGVYDWEKVPGVTNIYGTAFPQQRPGSYWSEFFFNNETFVGGVSDGLVGVATMAFNRPHEPLRHLKSWFFFDDVLVALGSDITLRDEDSTKESVITTLTQLVYDGQFMIAMNDGTEMGPSMGTEGVVESPAWLHHRNVGYVFLNGDEKLHYTVDTRHQKTNLMKVFTAWLDHSPTPKIASHSYAVLPAASLDQTRTFAQNPHVHVVAKTRNLHAVYHEPSQTLGVVFREAGDMVVVDISVGLKVDKPCLALITVKSETDVSLTLADPQQKYGVINFLLRVNDRETSGRVTLPGSPKEGSSITTLLTL